MKSIYYLKCKNCGHKKNVDSSLLDGNLLRLARKSVYELNKYFKLIRSKMLCKNCEIRGEVNLFVKITGHAYNESEKQALIKAREIVHKKNKKKYSTKNTSSGYRKAVKDIGRKSSVNYAKKKKSENYIRRIDEGLAGTREGHKKMRGQIWSEIKNRNL